MTRRIIATIGAAALLVAGIAAVPAIAAPVNRPLADELTDQYNRQVLQQLQESEAAAYPQPVEGPMVAQPLCQSPPPPQPVEVSPAAGPPQPAWSYLPR